MGDSSPITIFIPIFIVFLLLAIFVPIINMTFDNDAPDSNIDEESILDGANYDSIGFNLVTCMFWTFGLSTYFNIPLLFFRVIGLICLWYIIFPTK